MKTAPSNWRKKIHELPWEAFAWMAGLVSLVFVDPHDSHFTLCPIKNLGFEFCPGCGLGKSISFLFRGDLFNSFATHPLGIFAVIILSYRIIQLLKQHIKSHGTNY